jgi:adenine C2-methylase RlmN of 23S rRNA A2503 and tRNA A37
MLGWGEPLLNYKNVVSSIKKISSCVKNIKQATIITSGVSPSNIKRLARKKFKIKISLQFSLHAPTEEFRRSIRSG